MVFFLLNENRARSEDERQSLACRIVRFPGFLSTEPQIHAKLLEKREGVFVCNAILASRPKHPFWLAVMDSVRLAVQSGQREDPVSLTGVLAQRFLFKVGTWRWSAQRPPAPGEFVVMLSR